MSLLQEPQIQTSVYICTIECFIRQANIAMKFPCSYFVEWRTINSKNTVKTERHNPHQNQVTFQEKIVLQLEMLFDHAKMEFLKRDTIVELFLVSKSRPDQNKLVGRVNIDLGKVINVGMYLEPTEFKLNFCSIEGTLIMQFKALQQKLTTLTIQDLDKSSFMDFISQAAIKTQTKNQSMIISRFENQSLDKKEYQRVGRNQIRALSPGSSNAVSKSGFLSRSIARNQGERRVTVAVQRESFGQFNRLNDEAQANKNINTNNVKIDIQKNISYGNQVDNKSIKPIQAKLSFEVEAAAEINQNGIINKQNANLQESVKRQGFPAFQTDSNQNLLKKDVRFSNDQPVQEINQNHQELISAQFKRSDLAVRREVLNEAVNEQIEKLKQQVSASRADNELLNRQKSILQRKVEDSTSDLRNIKLQMEKLQQDIITKNKINQEEHSERVRNEDALNNLKKEYQKELQLNRQQSQLVDELHTKISYLETTNKQLVLQLQTEGKQYQEKITRYEQFIKNLQAQIEKQSESIKVYEISQTSLKTKIEDLETQNNESVNQIFKMRKELEEKMGDNQRKQSTDLEKLQKEETELKIIIEGLQFELQETTTKYHQLEKEISDIQTKYLQLESKYDEQVTINNHLQQLTNNNKIQQVTEQVVEEVILNHSEVLETCKQVEGTGVEAAAEIEKLKIQNESLTNQIEFLKSKMEMLDGELNASIETLKGENQSLRQTILGLESKIVSYSATENQLQQLVTANRELESDNILLKEEISQLHKELSDAQANNLAKVLQEENEELRQQARIVEAQVQCYQKELEVLKDEIGRIRQTRQVKPGNDKTSEYEEMISKLNANLEQQINQNTELEEAIVRYMEKEAMMKETLAVLDNQSKEIFTLVQEKEQNEKIYLKTIEDLQNELLSYKNESSSPKQLTPSPSPTKQPQFQGNQDLKTTIEELKEANSKLNEELMHLTMDFDDSKAKLEAEITQLTESLLNSESTCRKKEEAYSIKIKQMERSIKNRDIELEIWKSRVKEKEEGFHGLQAELSKLRSSLDEIEQQKFNLESANNQKDIKIIELQEQLQLLKSIPIETEPPSIPSDAPSPSIAQIAILQELKEKLLQKTLNSDWDSLLQSILDRSINGEDTSKLLSLQEKSRLLSKELQKIKAQLLKSDWRNQQEKIAAMGLFKKCESIVTQLIAAAQSLNQNQSSFL